MAETPLRTGFTTGACATAAAAAAAGWLRSGRWQDPVEIVLPRGQVVRFALAERREGGDWAEAGVIKDAGDDPDVTHGVTVRTRVRQIGGAGVRFLAGEGVGTVTKPGLPIPPGEPAINPVPREMIAKALGPGGWEVTVSIPGGAEIAAKTWNPRLGITGGLSVLGTTGIVRPFSCSAWIASIHRGVDVARAAGLSHVAGATGATSERAAQAHFGLPEHAMLDMGDFAGGMLKYLARHPVARVTVAGGIGKLAKLAQGAIDLHSSRSQVDFAALARLAGRPELARCNTALEALSLHPPLAALVAGAAREAAQRLAGPRCRVDVLLVDRAGAILAEAR
ncbi:cobalt-precorrin-5B (C(1))-methyltransferase [Mangrovicoccus sp. HB161399]|uniref:cobalt-precorrin-5B (C(1))-methyltransferase n=1 Tax=Mangrovicoccus sp. HB161399 TaxID=2720392 RepID=UPI00155296EE|nr:cobalt-precorrin-5B (C(1))-methyltransferase [Mangrovicoccus sp. HB161399]